MLLMSWTAQSDAAVREQERIIAYVIEQAADAHVNGFDLFYPSSEGGPLAYSAYSRSASRCRVGLAAARGDPIGPGCVIWQFQRCSRAVPTLKIRSAA